MPNNVSVKFVKDGVLVKCDSLGAHYCRLMDTLNNNRPAAVFAAQNFKPSTDTIVIYKLSDTITQQVNIARAVYCICGACRISSGKEKTKSLKKDDMHSIRAQQLQHRRLIGFKVR